MSNCQFCAALAVRRRIGRIDNAQRKRQGKAPIRNRYTVALVVHTYVSGNAANAGRSTDYRARGLGYALNFCPECGAKL